MIGFLASAMVGLSGLYLVGLASISLCAPARASRFLLGFAGSASTHYLELLVRLVVGGAILVRARHMLFSDVFSVFGWVLVLTTVGLLVVPWRWHQRFARLAVPYAVRHLRLLAVASFLLGGFILVAVLGGTL